MNISDSHFFAKYFFAVFVGQLLNSAPGRAVLHPNMTQFWTQNEVASDNGMLWRGKDGNPTLPNLGQGQYWFLYFH